MKKVINFLSAILKLYLILYISNILLKNFQIPIPSSIIGLIIFLMLLATKIIKEEEIKDFCEFMTKYMILFFIPIVVGIIDYFDNFNHIFEILTTIFISTTFVIITVGLFTYHGIKYTRFLRLKKGRK